MVYDDLGTILTVTGMTPLIVIPVGIALNPNKHYYLNKNEKVELIFKKN